ncbi:MAG TPA: hypothetical protein VGU90_04355 [Terriglobales bacterium]|nr:hypothetical protein [Terriglobales bacterium]
MESALAILPLQFGALGALMNRAITAIRRRRTWNLLPLLVFSLVVSYGLLATLLVLQDRTIDAQADLIHLAIKESRRLSVIATEQSNLRSNLKHQAHSSNAAPLAPSSADSKSPSTQVPFSNRASEIPSSQEKRPANTKPGRAPHKFKRSPFSRPPAEMTDPSDMRRTLFSI